MAPIVSIIMPVYNTEKYLERAIQSIIDQTIENWELILVDDGSTDQSTEICDRYAQKDSRIKSFHQVNSGQGAARNNGLKKANGEYVAFVDSDDWIRSDMLERMIRICDENSADIACCEFFIAYEDGRIDDRTKAEIGPEILNQKDAVYELLLDRKIQSFPCNKVLKRRLFEGIEFTVKKHYEDIGTLYKVFLEANTIAIYSVSLYYYFQRKNSTTHTLHHETAIIDHYDHMIFRQEMLDTIGEKYPEFRSDLIKISELAAIKLYNNCVFYTDAEHSLRKKYSEEATRYLKTISGEIFKNSKISKGHKVRLCALLYCPPIYRLMLWYTYRRRGNLS